MNSMETHRQEREQRDATRKAAWDSAARNEGVNRNLAGVSGPGKKGTLADRAKYQFEADSEDDEMENEIDNNLGMSPPLYFVRCLCGTWLINFRCTSRRSSTPQPTRPRHGRRSGYAEQAH
jgi:hypothetical protein